MLARLAFAIVSVCSLADGWLVVAERQVVVWPKSIRKP